MNNDEKGSYMNFFRDCNRFTEAEVNQIIQATEEARYQRVENAYCSALEDQQFRETLEKNDICIVANHDRSVFLFEQAPETEFASDLRYRYCLYYENRYYFFSVGLSDGFGLPEEYSGRDGDYYYVPGQKELIHKSLLFYSEDKLQDLEKQYSYINRHNVLDMAYGIAFYAETPITESQKEALLPILREMLIIGNVRFGFTTRLEGHVNFDKKPTDKELDEFGHLYIDDVLDFAVNSLSFGR